MDLLPSRPLRLAALLLPLVAAAPAGAADWITSKDGVVEVAGKEAHLRVTVPAPDTIRVRFSRSAEFAPDRSFAVEAAALAHPAPFKVEEKGDTAVIRAAGAGLRITRSPLTVALLDGQGEVVAEEAAPVALAVDGGKVSWSLAAGEHVFGLGDKAKGYDRRGQSFQLWNFDNYGWKDDSDPLYKSIPFLVFLRDGKAHGLFLDNPARSFVDVGEADPALLTWELDRGAVDLYLIAGPDPRKVVQAYTALVGRQPLPPLWSLGYHQCRYSYETEREFRDVFGKLREHKIPADVMWLDIDFQQGNAPFVVDAGRFPTFDKMVADARAQGLRTVVITDPHIKEKKGQAPYDTGVAGDHFIKEPGGDIFVGEVWPGSSVFPEFTLSRSRAWWGTLYADFVKRGVAGFWNDMNEPALFGIASKTMPEGLPHRLDDGTSLDHVAVHNVYGHLNARATYEGLLALQPDVRPFVLTRAAYAGTQRWAATWTGDNLATRDHMEISVPTLLNLGVSGYTFSGADMGGFAGCPSADLATEWTELGVYQPFFRNHSAKGTCRREPWVNGADHEKRRRAAIERRYQLLPYLYTAFEEASRTGLPVMRPLWLEYPGDPAAATDRNFLLGRDLLVLPRFRGSKVHLPAGDWFDVRTGAKVAGGRDVAPEPGKDTSVQVLARAGAIVPEGPVVQHTGELGGALTLHVYPGPGCKGSVYADDGQTFAYRTGAYKRVEYRCTPQADGIAVAALSGGSATPWWTSTQVVIHGVPRAPKGVSGGTGKGPAPAVAYDAATQSATITLASPDSDWSLSTTW
ncbi:MAG: glycoside hydrolase family 31 protein [Anaeromyxobacter sp.]